MLAKGVHLAAYLAPILPRFLDLHADARGLSFRQATFLSFLRQLRKSDWAESRDATPYDVTFDAADERESLREGHIHPRTYYRSYCATLVGARLPLLAFLYSPVLSKQSAPCGSQSSVRSWLYWLTALPMYASSTMISRFDFSSLRPIPAVMATVAAASQASKAGSETAIEDGVIDVVNGGDYLFAALRANDGVVPLFSQWHPFDCRCVSVPFGGSPAERTDRH